MSSVCVCVFGIIVLNIFVERWSWELKMLTGSLVELHAWLHSYLCFSLLEKWFLIYLDTSSISPRHLAVCRALKMFFITISTPSRQLCGSIEKVSGSSIASRHLLNRSRSSCTHLFFIFFFHSFFLCVHSILFFFFL